MNEIKILIADGCTESEAKNHLERGTVVYDDLPERFESYANEWQLDEEEREAIQHMINTKEPAQDWGVVEHEGKTFFIAYCL